MEARRRQTNGRRANILIEDDAEQHRGRERPGQRGKGGQQLMCEAVPLGTEVVGADAGSQRLKGQISATLSRPAAAPPCRASSPR